jgi:transcriptional regulator with XRE-family HTH domain
MFKIGQVVHTRRGDGVISSVGDSTPYVYVRLNAGPDEIYVMDRSDLTAGEADESGYPVASRINAAASSGEATGQEFGGDGHNKGPANGRRLSRRSTKKRSGTAPTPIARFVNERLDALGLKQCEFCRKTGFDQGLLSRIQSSMTANLSLESCLRLAIGCAVSPERIFELIGRSDFHTLITRSYSTSLQYRGTEADLVAVEMAGSRERIA